MAADRQEPLGIRKKSPAKKERGRRRTPRPSARNGMTLRHYGLRPPRYGAAAKLAGRSGRR